MKAKLLFIGGMLLLAGLACLSGVIPGTGGGEVLPPAPDTGGAPAQTGGACDPLSTPIQVGTNYSGSIAATTEDYPANCAYYCVWVPSGTSTLDIGISNFDVDLDLYMGFGELSSVRGADPEDAVWFSNEFGTDDESVSIASPSPDGAYYIEVCSYEGEASTFNLLATTQ